MTNVQFDKLLDRTSTTHAKYIGLLAQVSEECIERHGVHYADVSCDRVIDAIAGGQAGGISARQFDEAMEESLKINGGES
jgi:hypothetical protein